MLLSWKKPQENSNTALSALHRLLLSRCNANRNWAVCGYMDFSVRDEKSGMDFVLTLRKEKFTDTAQEPQKSVA